MGHKRRGRPGSGARLLDHLAGSEYAKQRLRLMLGTLAGQITVEQACAQLNIGEAVFFKLRTRRLQEMLAGLEPRTVGRPAEQAGPGQQRIEDLTAQIGQLEIQLQAARVREELALAGLVPRPRRPRREASPPTTPPSPDNNTHPVGSAGENPNAPAGSADGAELKKTNRSATE